MKEDPMHTFAELWAETVVDRWGGVFLLLDWSIELVDSTPSAPHIPEPVLPPGWVLATPEALRRILVAGFTYGIPAGLSNRSRQELLGIYRCLPCDYCLNPGPHTTHLFVRGDCCRGLACCAICGRASAF